MAVLASVQPSLVEGLDVAGAKTGAAATASSVMDRRLRALSASFGESWEQVLRLAARITGDRAGASDTSASVVWEAVEAESVQASVTALATAVGSLGVPAEGIWHHLAAVLPGATADDVETWKRLAAEADPVETLANAFARKTEPAAAPAAGEEAA